MVWSSPQASPVRKSRSKGGDFPAEPQSSSPVKLVKASDTPLRSLHKKNGSLSRTEGESSRHLKDPNRLLSEMAPHLMTPSMINALTRVSLQGSQGSSSRDPYPLKKSTLLLTPRFSMDHPARSLARISSSLLQFSGIVKGSKENSVARQPFTSMDVGVLEESQRILEGATLDLESSVDTASLDDQQGDEVPISLLRGFQATVPQAYANKTRRRRVRAIASGHEDQHGRSRQERRKRIAGSEKQLLSLEELEQQNKEVLEELQNVTIRRTLYNSEILNVDAKIAALQTIKSSLQQKLFDVREEELELEDEMQGLNELLELQRYRLSMPGGRGLDAGNVLPQPTSVAAQRGSSRRRKGPVFLPNEHDELPHGLAFMSLDQQSGPVTALDFSEPYGTLVTGSSETNMRVWDLSTGEEVGRLRGHTDGIKCLQVEDELCVSGSMDHAIRLWDLRRVDDHEVSKSGKLDSTDTEPASGEEPCVRVLEGHSKGVTALYFDDGCLVTGAADKTLRQWDLETGQCVMTMDILWAMTNASSHGTIDQRLGGVKADGSSGSLHGPSTDPTMDPVGSISGQFTGPFSYPMPPFEDGSWEMYQDFVGGIQFWGYALASGSGDGCVRLWDLRTGQAHRTLLGHTAPITCLQFDETHLISGSLDKTAKVWDLRMGNVVDTLHYDYPVTALQFDSRKILVANGSKVVDVC
ncbi:[histone H3]-dimethyl-L-lysine(36) demethylase [Malassezia yamatoensis]|uniref:[histone H3]-dimethyl-L-lysine(36) demethylase n=1 Tax=Malassezia yamatoensis TaxID=253288 RepID=A0AAJ5YNY5_9BASI|nr:[histone H3]-dimethyl-L-lysine(36) demethylase [Malassezia yamatoensis]